MSGKKYSERITWLFGFYNGGRMLVGAINTIFLLKRGVSLNEVALLQMIYTITVLLMEVPTGVIADVISRKTSVVLSTFFLVFYYLIVCISTPNVICLGIAQIIYALALCLVSGAFEGWQTNTVNYEYPDMPEKLNYYGHLKFEINSFITMFSGTLGAVIVYIGFGNYELLYIICSILMLILLISFINSPYYGNVRQEHKSVNIRSVMSVYYNEVKKGFFICFRSIDGICYFFSISFLVCTYQIVFYYWQPFFSIISKESKGFQFIKNNEEILMGVIFFAYSFSRFFINRFVRKKVIGKLNPFNIAIIALSLSAFSTILLTKVQSANIMLYIILFAIIQGLVTLVESVSESQFIKKVPSESISSSLSIASAATSLISIGLLGLLSRVLTSSNIKNFFFITALLYIAIILVIALWKKQYNENLVETKVLERG